MNLRPSVFALLLLALVCGPAISGQQAGQAGAGVIQLNVVVTPKSGKPVAGLQEKDFTVLDNKVERPITSFKEFDGSQEPIEVILVIDSVNTSFTTVAYERTQLDKFLQANGGHLSHPVSLAILRDQGGLELGKSSSDGNSIASSLDASTTGLRSITRSTGFYGATERLDISVKALQQLAASGRGRPGRKIILWLSPGWPLLSRTQGTLTGEESKGIFDEIVATSALLRQTHTTVYAINPLGANEQVINTFDYQNFLKGVSKANNANIGNLGLQVIAAQSGGLVISSTGIVDLLDQALEDTKAYYKISFEAAPAEQRDVYHHVEVQVDQPGLTARARDQYYAEP